MHKHPPNRSAKAPAKSPNRSAKPPISTKSPPLFPGVGSNDGGGFLSLLLQRITWPELNALTQRRNGAGRPVRVLSRGQLLAGLLFHYTVTLAGTFGEHLYWLLGMKMAESTLSERRQALPFEVFKELLSRVLGPLENPGTAAFYRQWSLVALDGVNFSLPNNEQVNGAIAKNRNQKGKTAFAKLRCAVLVELVMHNPLAACVGRLGESEWKLAKDVLEYLPQKCLLLGDRLYGCGAFLIPAMEHLKARGGHFLVRVKAGLTVVRCVKPLEDGSRIVEIKALEEGDTHRVAGTLQVREILATIQRSGFRPVQVRLWTSLLNPQEAPAEELVHVYTKRWEHELYFRELKKELGINDLLRSQTVETAAQEVAAMIVGSSLIARERAKLKPGEELQHRISFLKTWETLEPLWMTLLLGADILSEKQKQQLCERFYQLASRRRMAKKRTRTCPRAMRQPVQPWPRKKGQLSSTAAATVTMQKPHEH